MRAADLLQEFFSADFEFSYRVRELKDPLLNLDFSFSIISDHNYSESSFVLKEKLPWFYCHAKPDHDFLEPTEMGCRLCGEFRVAAKVSIGGISNIVMAENKHWLIDDNSVQGRVISINGEDNSPDYSYRIVLESKIIPPAAVSHFDQEEIEDAIGGFLGELAWALGCVAKIIGVHAVIGDSEDLSLVAKSLWVTYLSVTLEANSTDLY
ncbi:MAG: hypothetical protein RLZZ330_200 [Actinomycetota bacterium]